MFSENYIKILKYITFIFLLTFFIGGRFLIYSLIIFFITIISLSIYYNQIKFKFKKPLIYIVLLYLTYIIGILYSVNKQNAFLDIEVKTSLIAFPLVFSFTSKTFKILKKYYLLFFLFASYISSIFLISNALIKYISTGNSSNLLYSNFSFLIHPSYLGMYLIFSIITGITLYKNSSKKIKIIIAIGSLINIISIYLSDSKSALLSGIIILLIISFRIIYKKSKLYLILSLILISVFIFLLFKTKPRFKMMFNVISSYKEILNNPNTYKESTGIRILSWNAALKLIKENPILGVGTDDAKEELIKTYKELNYTNNVQLKLNAHNQFLETFIATGIFGFITLLLIFIIPFIKAIKEKNLLLILFLVIVFFNFMFESMLNRQAGVVFFAFFYTLLVTNKPIENTYQ